MKGMGGEGREEQERRGTGEEDFHYSPNSRFYVIFLFHCLYALHSSNTGDFHGFQV